MLIAISLMFPHLGNEHGLGMKKGCLLEAQPILDLFREGLVFAYEQGSSRGLSGFFTNNAIKISNKKF